MPASRLTEQYNELRRLANRLPQSQKQVYLLDLTEDDFRDKVIRPLFKRLGYTDGRDTCGPDEMGRDAIFTQQSELAGLEVTVVQTKRGKVTKSSKPSENLDSIVVQLRTALTTPVKLLSKVKKRPLRAYLIASGEINKAAQDYIADELDNPQLFFLDGPSIIPLIDEHIPELWLNIESDVISYFQAVAHQLEQSYDLLPDVTNPLSLKHSVTTDDFFAQLSVYRRTRTRIPNKRRQAKGTPPRLDTTPITGIFSRGESLILLVGGAGAGKSTALQRIIYEAATKRIERKADVRIPIYMRAKDLALDINASLLDHSICAIKQVRPDLKVPYTSDDLQEGRVVMMVDGLDEVSDDTTAAALVSTITSFNAKYPRCKILLTSRDAERVENLENEFRFVRFDLAPLTIRQVLKLVNAYANRYSLGPEDSTTLIQRLEEMHGVDLSPLIVTIFVATSSTGIADAPANITQLFDKYTRLMLGLWDESKGLSQQILAPLKHFVVGQVAFKMHEARRTSLGEAECREWIFEELGSRGYEGESDELYLEITERSGLFRFHDGLIEFRHHVIQEYFAGIAIADRVYVQKVLEDDWWRNPIVFYFGTNPGSVSELRDISQRAISSPPSISAMSAIGLSLQACYLAHLDDKRTVYRDLIRLLVDSVDAEGDLPRDFIMTPIHRVATLLLLVRDATALAALKLIGEQVRDDVLLDYQDKSAERQYAAFWLIVGLVESGEYDQAEALLEHARLFAAKLLFALAVENVMVTVSRIVPEAKRKALAKLNDALFESIADWDSITSELDRETVLLKETAKKRNILKAADDPVTE